MRRVVIESPYGSDDPEVVAKNIKYLRACMHDCLQRGESPYASHAMYTQPGVLCDEDATERDWGINAGFAWRDSAELSVVYEDRGHSTGMKYGVADAEKKGRPVEYRSLGADWEEKADACEATRPGLGW